MRCPGIGAGLFGGTLRRIGAGAFGFSALLGRLRPLLGPIGAGLCPIRPTALRVREGLQGVPPVDANPPRWAAPMPIERASALPWLFLPAGTVDRYPTLVCPYGKRRAGLTDAQRATVDAMVARIPAPLPAVPCWLDAQSGRVSRVEPVDVAWLQHKLRDHHAVQLRAGP